MSSLEEDHGYRHVIIDSSALVAAICPKLHRNPLVHDRTSKLIAAASSGSWSNVRLLTSSLCIAEVQSVLDKARYCTWAKKKRTKPLITQREHEHASNRVTELHRRQFFATIETSPDIVLAAAVISRINQKYQFRRRTESGGGRIKGAMGAADNLIVATGIIVKQRVAPLDVVLVTADQRMSDVCRKARRLDGAAAKGLRLPQLAKRAGFTWRKDCVPSPLLIQDASEKDLAQAFAAWPLPERWKTRGDVTSVRPDVADFLVAQYAAVKARTKKGVEKLPYSPELNQIRANVTREKSVRFTNQEIFELLQSWRKKGRFDLEAGRLKPES